jgi:endonuclease/exonuclease/phosphatase family metal-dependent hydrolase
MLELISSGLGQRDRHVMWELIRRIKLALQAPWLMIGDFNEAMWPFEHLSARKHSER